jgi:hypothetical protein
MVEMLGKVLLVRLFVRGDEATLCCGGWSAVSIFSSMSILVAWMASASLDPCGGSLMGSDPGEHFRQYYCHLLASTVVLLPFTAVYCHLL